MRKLSFSAAAIATILFSIVVCVPSLANEAENASLGTVNSSGSFDVKALFHTLEANMFPSSAFAL